jgi:hypothetical protein
VTGWQYVLAGVGFALVVAVAVAVALLAGRFCALTTAPERHPSNWKPADRDGAS